MADVVPTDVTMDSISFYPALSDPDSPSAREWVYVDAFRNSESGRAEADYAIRDSRYKLLRHQSAVEFYDLQEDPYEHNNLLDQGLSASQQSEFERLQKQITTLHDSRQ
jgi:hypothetical protein